MTDQSLPLGKLIPGDRYLAPDVILVLDIKSAEGTTPARVQLLLATGHTLVLPVKDEAIESYWDLLANPKPA